MKMGVCSISTMKLWAVIFLTALASGCQTDVTNWDSPSDKKYSDNYPKRVTVRGYLFSIGDISKNIDKRRCESVGPNIQIYNFHDLLKKKLGLVKYSEIIGTSKIQGTPIKISGYLRKIKIGERFDLSDKSNIFPVDSINEYELFDIQHFKLDKYSACEIGQP
jgi:hypothetical protein